MSAYTLWSKDNAFETQIIDNATGKPLVGIKRITWSIEAGSKQAHCEVEMDGIGAELTTDIDNIIRGRSKDAEELMIVHEANQYLRKRLDNGRRRENLHYVVEGLLALVILFLLIASTMK